MSPAKGDRDPEEQLALDRQLAWEAQLGLDKEARPADSPYFDEVGQPQLAEAAVLFLDLLGTRAIRSPVEAKRHLGITHLAVRQARAWSLAGNDKRHEGAIYSFSDNIGLGYPIHGGWEAASALAFLAIETGYLQLAFLVHGLFSRGGISVELFFADPTLDFIHGPALERAVTLEHTLAVYPRVILDEAAVAIASAAIVDEERESGDSSGWRQQLLVDEHGVVFVNYLHTLFDEVAEDVPSASAFLPKHRRYIEENLRRYERTPRVEDKYRWAAAYHNYFVETYGPDKLEKDPSDLLVSCSRPLDQFAAFGS
jgi:hypothetical protein